MSYSMSFTEKSPLKLVTLKSFKVIYSSKKGKRNPSPLVKTATLSESLVVQSYPTLCNSMDCSPPGSSIHAILRTRILEWFATSFSRGSS